MRRTSFSNNGFSTATTTAKVNTATAWLALIPISVFLITIFLVPAAQWERLLLSEFDPKVWQGIMAHLYSYPR
jgi:hypothetical protein